MASSPLLVLCLGLPLLLDLLECTTGSPARSPSCDGDFMACFRDSLPGQLRTMWYLRTSLQIRISSVFPQPPKRPFYRTDERTGQEIEEDVQQHFNSLPSSFRRLRPAVGETRFQVGRCTQPHSALAPLSARHHLTHTVLRSRSRISPPVLSRLANYPIQTDGAAVKEMRELAPRGVA
ncbi:hypothetical protein VTK56DRAFT_1959 [Thermocarpiscus australiensis]